MAYNEKMADRVREIIAARTKKKIEEKKMFGGLCFMIDDKMCVGVQADNIMVRIAEDEFDKAVEENGFEPMVHNGRTMANYGYVSDDVLKTKKQLEHWVGLAMEYNKTAKSSKKKKA